MSEDITEASAPPEPAELVPGPWRLYRQLVESVVDYAIFALDAEGHILSWNAGAERSKGYTAGEIIGRHFSIFYPEERVAEGFPAYELKVASREGRFEDEGWRLRKDGTRFWANVVITALRDEAGKLVGFAKVTRDLTERRRAEDALRRGEERFRLLVQGVRDYAIFMLDEDGRVATWNEGAERINGYTADEIIGEHLSLFYPPDDVTAGRPTLELEIALRDGRFEDEGWRLRKDGSRFWANVVVTALRHEDGELIGFAKITRDLTERRASEERALEDARRIAAEEAARRAAETQADELQVLLDQLHEQAAELEERNRETEMANRAKTEFLAAMSHELRTPLNAIGGYAELMEMEIGGPLTDHQRTQLERIRRSQQHLLGLINDILNFSRIESGQLSYEIGPVSVGELVAEVTDLMAAQAQLRGLTLDIAPIPADLVAVGDRAKVEQVLLNLLSNAFKFTEPGGRISLSASASPGAVTITVRDTGVGIPADRLEAIFEPFVQVGRSLSNMRDGTGLGLAISRDLARGMGGELSVTSALGEGSEFQLRLRRQ